MWSNIHYFATPLYIARTMLSQDVCPSVIHRYCVETAKRIIKRFFHYRVTTAF